MPKQQLDLENPKRGNKEKLRLMMMRESEIQKAKEEHKVVRRGKRSSKNITVRGRGRKSKIIEKRAAWTV